MKSNRLESGASNFDVPANPNTAIRKMVAASNTGGGTVGSLEFIIPMTAYLKAR